MFKFLKRNFEKKGKSVKTATEVISVVFITSLIVVGTVGATSIGNNILTNTMNILGNLTVDSGTFFVDTSNDRVGIGTMLPGYTLDVAGDINFTGNLTQNGSAFSSGSGTSTSQWSDITGGISYTSGNVGIGVSEPDANLHVYGGDSQESTLTIGGSSSSEGACLKLRDSDGAGWTYCTFLDGAMSCSQTSCASTISSSITVSADSGKPDDGIVIAGLAADQDLHRISLSAVGEDFVVDELTFEVTDSTAYDSINYLKLYDVSDSALSSGVGLDSGKANFTGLSISVSKDSTVDIVIKGKIEAIGTRSVATDGTAGSGADTGDSISLSISTTDNDFSATGSTSGNTDIQADAAVGNTLIVRKTVPEISVETLPSTILTNGASKVLSKFSISADSNDDLSFISISPEINISGSVSVADIEIYDVTSGSTLLSTAIAGPMTATTSDIVYIVINDDNVVDISAGATKTFEIRATIADVGSGDSVATTLVQDTAMFADNLPSQYTHTSVNGLADTYNRFIWSDKSADTNGTSSVEWINGYGISNWPTSASTLSE